MKRIAYKTPEMEIVRINVQSPLLNISTGGGDPVVHDEPVDPNIPPILE